MRVRFVIENEFPNWIAFWWTKHWMNGSVQSSVLNHLFVCLFSVWIFTQSASSPRRVAVPVLVKDGKPCSNNSNNSSQAAPAQNQQSQHPQQQQQAHQQQQQLNSNTTPSNNNNVIVVGDVANTHSPDTSSTLLSSYNGVQHSQMLQQPCNNSLMSSSLAMAYRNQNNFMGNSHQQQCGSYIPMQGRAW